MPLRTSVVSPKYLYIRCAQIGLGRGAREGVYPQRYSTDRATKPQANFSATRRRPVFWAEALLLAPYPDVSGRDMLVARA